MEFTTILWVSLLLILFSLIYRYVWEPTKFWEKKGVTHIPAFSVLGFFAVFKGQSDFHETLQLRYKKYGRIYGQFEGLTPNIAVAEPELLRNIFVKDFQFFGYRRDFSFNDPIAEKMVSTLRGEEWKRVRTVITPAFTTGKIKKMSSIMLSSAQTVVKNLEEARKSGKPINTKSIFGAFSMDVIASSAFGTKIDSHNNPDNPFAKAASNIFASDMRLQSLIIVLFPGLARFLDVRIFDKKSMEFFRAAVLEIIKERKRSGKKQNDMLQLFLDAEVEENISPTSQKDEDDKEAASEESIRDIGHEEANDEMFKSTTKYKNLTHDELVANCVIFFIAGYDTTASTLAFTSYNLTMNPHCQEKLIEEIDEALRQNNNQLTYAALQSMKYLDNAISETLRLYPPINNLEREAEADYKLGDTGITIPKGMNVHIPIYAMQRDPEFFHDPEKFEPNRFLPEEKAKRNPYTYLPFGAGPRNCLGMRFVLIEIKFCLAAILSQYRFKRCPETKVPLEFFKVSGLLQPKDIMLAVEKREDSVWNQ